jgi:hypothetical protein
MDWVCLHPGSDVLITRCRFTDNARPETAAAAFTTRASGRGGGIYLTGVSLGGAFQIYDSLFSGNKVCTRGI